MKALVNYYAHTFFKHSNVSQATDPTIKIRQIQSRVDQWIINK